MTRTRSLSVLAFAAAWLLSLIAYEAVANELWRSSTFDANAAPRTVAEARDLLPEEKATISLFESTSPSVVHIETTELRRQLFSRRVAESPQGTGSGFVWDARGYIVTNFHVVQGVADIRVTLADKTQYLARLVANDSKTDLAVIKIEASKRLPIMPCEPTNAEP